MGSNRKNRESHLQNAASVLQNLLSNGNDRMASQFQRWRLWSQWGNIVGPTMASYCYPVDYEAGTLVIFVDSSVRLQEVSFLSGEIIYKVNAFVGKRWTRRIRYTLDRHSIPNAKVSDEKFRKFIEEE